jgi:hypothetical protein
MNGAPAIPASVPAEQVPFVGMRPVPGAKDGLEAEMEIYDTRTGKKIETADED